MEKPKTTRSTHIFFLIFGLLVAWWGGTSIDDAFKQPMSLSMGGGNWQVGALLVAIGGVFVGVAIDNIVRERKPQKVTRK
jgi:TRAP-type C4-dicarboxylate transport system permease small subunit